MDNFMDGFIEVLTLLDGIKELLAPKCSSCRDKSCVEKYTEDLLRECTDYTERYKDNAAHAAVRKLVRRQCKPQNFPKPTTLEAVKQMPPAIYNYKIADMRNPCSRQGKPLDQINPDELWESLKMYFRTVYSFNAIKWDE